MVATIDTQSKCLVLYPLPEWEDLEAQIKALSKLPGREELLATLVGTLQAPIAKFVQTLNEVPSAFVRTLAAIEEKKSAEAA